MPEVPDTEMNIFDRVRFSPFNVHLIVIRRCNLSCGYCNEYDKVSLPVAVSILKGRIDKIAELGALSVHLTGGEPLLHPKVAELVKYAKSKIRIVAMISNSYLLTEEKVEELNKAGLDYMQISIDGVEPNRMTAKVLKPNRWRLEMLSKKAKFKINLNSVIGSTNPEEALEVIKFGKKLGFDTTIGLIHDGGGKIKLSKKQSEVYKEAHRLRKVPFWGIYDFEDELINKGVSDFKCRAGSRYLYIDEFGDVAYCSQQRKLFKKSLKEYSIEDLKRQFFTKKACSNGCTVGCVRRASYLDSFRKQDLLLRPV